MADDHMDMDMITSLMGRMAAVEAILPVIIKHLPPRGMQAVTAALRELEITHGDTERRYGLAAAETANTIRRALDRG